MGFRSNMPYTMNTQLQQRVDDKQARDKAAFAPGGINDGTPWYQRESYLKATGQEIAQKPAEKIEWADGLGNNIKGLITFLPAYTPVASGIVDASIYDLFVKLRESIEAQAGNKYRTNFAVMNIVDINKYKLKKDANNNYRRKH